MGPTQFALQMQDKQKQLSVAFCRGCCSENVKTFTKKLIALSVLNITVARERRRGDRPPTKNVIWDIYIW
jgi:hypothetical protein